MMMMMSRSCDWWCLQLQQQTKHITRITTLCLKKTGLLRFYGITSSKPL